MTLLVPSYWLAERVKRELPEGLSGSVIYNGIDLDIYRPTPSDFRKNIIWRINLWFWGVANVWQKERALHIFGIG